MYFMFNSEVAETYGTNEAVFIQNIFFWIEKNRANGRHFYEGRYWTYSSMDAFTELFPFLTKKQIRGVIARLSTAGAIHIGNFNKKGFDRTQWYSLSDDVLGMLSDANGHKQVTERAHPCAPEGTPIPDINTDSKPDIPPISPKGESEGFDNFWIAYPRKIAKANALKSWRKIKPDAELQKTILAALERHKKTEQWTKDKGQFIPHPATWLNQSRWQDEIDSTTTQQAEPAKPRKFERREVNGEWVDVEVFD